MIHTRVAYFVYEFVALSNLQEFVGLHGGLDEWICKYYFKELLKALRVSHQNGIVHRDIHPENVMIDANFDLKLSEFTKSCDNTLAKKSTGMGMPGCPGYMAPEMYLGKYNTQDADMFACGVLLFFMRTGHQPFEEATNRCSLYRKISRGDMDAFWSLHEK